MSGDRTPLMIVGIVMVVLSILTVSFTVLLEPSFLFLGDVPTLFQRILLAEGVLIAWVAGVLFMGGIWMIVSGQTPRTLEKDVDED